MDEKATPRLLQYQIVLKKNCEESGEGGGRGGTGREAAEKPEPRLLQYQIVLKKNYKYFEHTQYAEKEKVSNEVNGQCAKEVEQAGKEVEDKKEADLVKGDSLEKIGLVQWDCDDKAGLVPAVQWVWIRR